MNKRKQLRLTAITTANPLTDFWDLDNLLQQNKKCIVVNCILPINISWLPLLIWKGVVHPNENKQLNLDLPLGE